MADSVTVNPDDSIEVVVDGVRMIFRDVVCRTRTFDATLTVFYPPEPTGDALKAAMFASESPFEYHIGAKSLSNVTAYRRALQDYYRDESIAWQRILHEGCRAAEGAFVNRVHSAAPELPDDYEYDNRALVAGVFPLNRVSMVFGMGETAKSLGLQSVCADASRGVGWVGRATNVRARTLWLDYESESVHDFAERKLWLTHGGHPFAEDSIRWMAARGIPVTEMVDALTREIERFNLNTVVVDSVAYACGGDPSKAENATSFYNALARLPLCTKLLIAHTDKAENDRYAFGSIFWHNGLHGTSWFVQTQKEQDRITQGWYLRKSSSGPRPHDFAVQMDFEPDSVTVGPGNLTALNQATGMQTVKAKIMSAIHANQQGLTTQELAKVIGESDHVTRTRANELKDVALTQTPEKKWVLLDQRHMDEDEPQQSAFEA